MLRGIGKRPVEGFPTDSPKDNTIQLRHMAGLIHVKLNLKLEIEKVVLYLRGETGKINGI